MMMHGLVNKLQKKGCAVEPTTKRYLKVCCAYTVIQASNAQQRQHQTEMAASKKSSPAIKSAESAAKSAPAPAPPPSPEVGNAATPVPEVSDDVNQRITSAIERVQQVQAAVKDLVALLKTLQKDVAKLQKRDGKKTRRTAANATAAAGGEAQPRKPSGFAKPTLLSKELCDFLGVPADSMLARTEVTRLLNKYVKDHNLQDPQDKRTIRPDNKLQKVLNIDGNVQLTYFNLQSHIKHHFVKGAEAAVSA
jgi:chromatin remodeling complex protein RSC6